MISDLKPYPAMKDSDVPWLEEVPEHWVVAPGRACFKESHKPNTGLIEKTVLSLSYGQIVVKPEDKLHGLVPASFETYQIVEPGDIICRPTDLQNDKTSLRFGFSGYRGIITSAYICLRTLDCIDRRFAHLLLHAYDLKKIFYGLGSGLRQNLDWRDFKTLPCLLPPLPEQVAIVRFLDHVDGRVRRYIRSKQKLIKLLEEQKQVIIHHAVTRGLDPNVRLKPSGVEWLGDVPEHWDVAALRHRYSQCLGKMLDSKKITARNSLPYLRNTDIQWDRINVENLPLMDISPEEYDRYTVREKDLLVCEGGDVGRCALWSGEMSLCGFQKALHRLRPRNVNQDVPRFMYYILRAAAKCEAFNDGHLSTIAHLTGDKLRAHRFPFPRKEEQESLVSFLDATLNQIDEAISTTFSEVSLLREYRTRLISDVVTGKLDVRDIELPAADAEAPEECSDLPDIETALEDQEMEEEIPAEGD
jgi:type I restriction enzyme S subunit